MKRGNCVSKDIRGSLVVDFCYDRLDSGRGMALHDLAVEPEGASSRTDDGGTPNGGDDPQPGSSSDC